MPKAPAPGGADSPPAPPRLELTDITKRFGPLLANDRINLSGNRQSIHAVLGENGAGKSTLMNILFGLYQPDGGQIRIDGRRTTIASPRHALALGIGMVHQHFMQVPTLSVIENIVLGGRGSGVGRKRHGRRIAALAEQFGFDIDLDARIGQLPIGMQQRAEILKLLYHEAEILILDEPTSVLTPVEIDPFFDVLRNLRGAGKTVLLITHKMDEVMAVADRVTVLRHGRVMTSVTTAETTPAHLVELMVGRGIAPLPRRDDGRRGPAFLSLDRVSAVNDRGTPALQDVSLTVHQGEILAIAGVDGNGQSELAEVITGLRPLAGGAIAAGGRNLDGVSVAARRHEVGIGYIPEDRQRTGLVLTHSIAWNTVLRAFWRHPFARAGLLRPRRIRDHAIRLVDRFDVRLQSIDQEARVLSGGNQQKVIVARELDGRPRVLVVAQPTKGLDVGAIDFVQRHLLEERDRGAAILYISTELEHLLDVADRVGVLFRGRLVALMDRAEATSVRIGAAMAGLADAAEASAVTDGVP